MKILNAENMKVTAQIAALNESGSIARVIENIPKEIVDEILVVDGHSTDNTVEIAESFGCRALTNPGMGYGDAHIYGLENATGDIVVILDADYSQDPRDIPRLLQKLEEGYDMAVGSRYMPGASTEDDTFIRHIGNKIFTFLANLIHGIKTSDSLYFYVAAKKDILKSLNLKSKDFAIAMEVLVKAHKAGYTVGEIPCHESKRYADVSRVNAFIDGFKILWQMLWW